MHSDKKLNVGIIGTGFIGNGLLNVIRLLPDMQVSAVLTHRDPTGFDQPELYTDSVQELIDRSDLVAECSGDILYAAEVTAKVLQAGLPVVTMDAELQITAGTYLSTLGMLSEAEGDQPGALAALGREVTAMGFRPLVYGNLKGFLNLNPTLEDMQYWARVQGISLEQVTGFTDGTKVQIEAALVANGLGAAVAQQGLYGYESLDVDEGAKRLAEAARGLGTPISDYLLCSPKAPRKFPAGVFITAEYGDNQAPALKYLKMGEGPFYTLVRNYHLCHIEIPKTIRMLMAGDILLDNSAAPTASVGAIAKHVLEPGTVIRRADRNFAIRGEALKIKGAPAHVPIGLMSDAVIVRRVEPGQLIDFADVEIPDSLAYRAWRHTLGSAGVK